MSLPDGQYIQILTESPVYCFKCERAQYRIAVSNEVALEEDGNLIGLEAVVRFVGCGHRVPGALADEERVAMVLERIAEED